MKIGILTFHRAINYGAVLQCYALYKILSNQGHQVEVIDYRPDYIEKYRKHFRERDFWKAKGLLPKIKYVTSKLLTICSTIKVKRKFDDFIGNNIPLSAVVVRHECDIPSYYDAIFFGSDQIWNPIICEGFDNIYYGQFRKRNAKFIGYAVSVGLIESITSKECLKFTNFLLNYDFLSVREQNLKQFIQDKCGREVELVCDPSLLLGKKEYERLAIPPKESGYVLLFSLEKNPFAKRFANHIASQMGVKVIQIMSVANSIRNCFDNIRSCLSPMEFLGYILHADCVITNSFHATSFSIIMQKNFYTIERKNNNARLTTLLKTVGLDNRFVSASENLIYSPVSYQGVDDNIISYRKSSLKFISKSLNS